jgi:hypothetical protein
MLKCKFPQCEDTLLKILKERKFHLCGFHRPGDPSSSLLRIDEIASGRGSARILRYQQLLKMLRFSLPRLASGTECVIFEDENQLPAGVTEVLMAILPEELEAVFVEWLSKLDAFIQGDRESVE